MSRTNRPSAATGSRRQRPRPVAPVAPDTTDAASMPVDDSASVLSQPDALPQPALPPTDDRFVRLRHLYEVVADVGDALNIPPARLAEGEALDRLEVVARLSVEHVARCEGNRARGWFAALADDLTLDLRVEGLDPDMPAVAASLRAESEPAEALRAFQQAAQSAAASQGDDISVEARLSAGKTRALALARDIMAQRPGVAAPETVAVFYLAAAWNRLITLATVPYLEQSGLIRADDRTGVLLCDSAGYLAGAALECVGVGAATTTELNWLPITPAAFRQFVAREAAARRLLAEENGWPGAPHIVTVERLRLVARAPGLEATAERLTFLRAEMAAASLASVVQGTMSDGLKLRFAGVRPATCLLPAADANGAPLPATEPAGEPLARLAEWATRHGAVDTLVIARECLARELPPGHTVSLAEVMRAAVDALEAAKANFSLFVRGQTDHYFAARQTAQDAVADYAETMRKAVSDLTSDVVDNLYRTVGLLAAVVIAGLIQPDVSPVLALLAAILYSGYIAFVIFFLLRARADHFTLEQAALASRLA
ncbi:MAG: hypothetical protein ACM3N4_09710, partial [Nitrososphaerota archaeon]